MDRVPDVDVLVAGAGPVGLTMALELARRGVRVRVVDAAAGSATTSRATANHARTLEVYDQMGVLQEILELGQPVNGFTVHQRGRPLVRFDTNFSQLPTRYPFSLQIDQVRVERVLRDRLRTYGVEPEWGVAVEFVEVLRDRGGVRVRLANERRGTEEFVVPWMVGADGAHSTVRKHLGIPLVGDNAQTWLIADAVVEVDLPQNSLHWMQTGGGSVMLVPFPDQGHWRLLDTVDVDSPDDPKEIAARFAAKISAGCGRPVVVHPPTWVSVFTIRQRMVPRMQHDTCFVAGDAAHVHSPASGQGMNTGIQDAFNLGWKLADVVRGHADRELLDSYSVERVPVGQRLLGATRTATRLVGLREASISALLPVGAAVLRTVRPIKRRVESKIQHGMSGLALSYPDSPLTIARHGSDAVRGGVVPGGRVGCSVEAERTSPGWRALGAELADPRWTLLAFVDGTASAGSLDRVVAGYQHAVSVRTVVGGRPVGVGPAPLADPGDLLRDGLGARSGDYLLIRPDGYLSAHGRLADDLPAALRRLYLRAVQAAAA